MPLMDKATKLLLKRKLVELVDEIDLKVDLWNELVNRRVVTETQKEDIIKNDRHTVSEQKTLLIELLPRRGQDKFHQFCLALVATEQDLVVSDVLGLDLDKNQSHTEGEAGSSQHAQTPATGSQQTTSQTTSQMTSHSSLPMDMSPSGGSDAPPPSCLPGGSSNQKRVPDYTSVYGSPEKKARHDLPHELEEDGIELTDAWGHQTEPVVTATESFYLSHRDPKWVYPMYLATRGMCLIINVGSVCGEPRRGTDIDNAHLIHLFSSLHFEVMSFSDQDGLSAAEIIQKVKAFAMMTQHAVSNCAVMCVLSHGLADIVYGTDGKPVDLRLLYKLLNDSPGLDNKPKLVFLESCAGLDYDGGKTSYTSLHGEDEDDAPTKLPYMSDFFIGRPSQPGMRAHRNTKQGSWYVQAVVKVFTKFAATRSLPELMIRVNAAVAKKESNSSDPLKTGKKQMPDQRLNLRRNLYFHPGIQRTLP